MGKTSDVYYSRVYTDRPEYADFEAPKKFQAIQGIVARRLREHPKAICSYRAKYNEYKANRRETEQGCAGQYTLFGSEA